MTMWQTLAMINKMHCSAFSSFVEDDLSAALEFKAGLIEYIKKNNLSLSVNDAANEYYNDVMGMKKSTIS